MRILVFGGDGYLGWPTAMHFSERRRVMVVDNFSKRQIELNFGIGPLEPVTTLHRRVALWKEVTGREISCTSVISSTTVSSIKCWRSFSRTPSSITPNSPPPPIPCGSGAHAVYTQYNNVIGTLNLLFAIKRYCPEAHLVKLGTMGEYGTPNIDIEEGYITIEHNGRTDTLPFPKTPGSLYHLSKVHDSHNIHFACRNWGLRATDLNQGVVYGIETDQTRLRPGLAHQLPLR